jgi:hypothetical protein
MGADDSHRESPTRLTVACPGCQAELVVDLATGTVLWHQPVPPPTPASLDDLVKHSETKRREVAERFERERRALDDRGRVLDEKVKEALKRVDPSAPPPIRPIDLD